MSGGRQVEALVRLGARLWRCNGRGCNEVTPMLAELATPSGWWCVTRRTESRVASAPNIIDIIDAEFLDPCCSRACAEEYLARRSDPDLVIYAPGEW